MELWWRVVGAAWERIPRPSAPGPAEVVLCHVPSGQVLTDGSDPGREIRFPSRHAAHAFCSRFLDEAPGWEAVVVAAHRAA